MVFIDLQLGIKEGIVALFGMPVGGFNGSHAAYIPVEFGTDMIEFMKNHPELLLPGKIEKTGHIKVDDIETGSAVAGYFRKGVNPAPESEKG